MVSGRPSPPGPATLYACAPTVLSCFIAHRSLTRWHSSRIRLLDELHLEWGVAARGLRWVLCRCQSAAVRRVDGIRRSPSAISRLGSFPLAVGAGAWVGTRSTCAEDVWLCPWSESLPLESPSRSEHPLRARVCGARDYMWRKAAGRSHWRNREPVLPVAELNPLGW